MVVLLNAWSLNQLCTCKFSSGGLISESLGPKNRLLISTHYLKGLSAFFDVIVKVIWPFKLTLAVFGSSNCAGASYKYSLNNAPVQYAGNKIGTRQNCTLQLSL